MKDAPPFVIAVLSFYDPFSGYCSPILLFSFLENYGIKSLGETIAFSGKGCNHFLMR